MDRWAGRVALVTGASSGIGEALAKQLVEFGMKVVGCGRNVGKIEELAKSLKGSKGSLTAIKCDLGKEADILAMFEKIKKLHGKVDVCVNNAGLAIAAPLLSGNTSSWRNMSDVNILALSICTRESYKLMNENNINDGHIFFISSMGGHRVSNSAISHFYMATKFAVRALAEGVHNELREAKSNIRITSISPGMVETPFAFNTLQNQAIVDHIFKQVKALEAKDIADTVIYALQAPAHVQVKDLLVVGVDQPTDLRSLLPGNENK